MIMNMRPCTKCGINKELTDYPKGKNYRDGYKRQCKACYAIKHKENYQTNREKYK